MFREQHSPAECFPQTILLQLCPCLYHLCLFYRILLVSPDSVMVSLLLWWPRPSLKVIQCFHQGAIWKTTLSSYTLDGSECEPRREPGVDDPAGWQHLDRTLGGVLVETSREGGVGVSTSCLKWSRICTSPAPSLSTGTLWIKSSNLNQHTIIYIRWSLREVLVDHMWCRMIKKGKNRLHNYYIWVLFVLKTGNRLKLCDEVNDLKLLP